MGNDIKQYYGIKFPFTTNNRRGFFIDLNQDYKSKIESEIAHVLLTTKGTRLRMPDFGTGLINFIFANGENDTLEGVKDEIRTSVRKYVPNVNIDDLNIVVDTKDGHAIYVDVHYSLQQGNKIINNRMVINI